MTPAELKVLDFIRDRIERTGLAPTIAEITTHIGAKSKGSAARSVEGLISQGLILRTRFKARGLTLPDVPNLDAVPTEALRLALKRRDAAGARPNRQVNHD